MAVALKAPTGLALPWWTLGTHTYVIGQPGVGKSRTLESWFLQAVGSGQGVGVIDPHGDLFDHLLSRLSLLAADNPEIMERIVVINPVDPTWTVGFNPLQAIDGFSSERLASFLTDVVVKIWRIDQTSAPRMIRLLTFTFLALSCLGLGLVDLPRFLVDYEWRGSLVSQIRQSEVQSYFQYEFPKTEAATHQWVTPVLNKIGALLFDPDLRPMFTARSTINFRALIDGRRILLVNLSKGLLGEGNSAILGAFIVAHLQKAALSRANQTMRRPFFLYLDEFQNYTTDNIQDILSESRKYALSLVLAHQYLAQLTPELEAAVLNTAGTLVIFRVGYQDASLLARELFRPGYLVHKGWDLRFAWMRRGLIPVPVPYEEPLSFDELTTLLTTLREREFVVRHRGPYPPQKLRTLDMPSPTMSERLLRARAALVNCSGQRYGMLKREVKESASYDRLRLNDALSKQFLLGDYEET